MTTPRMSGFTEADVPNQSGKCFIVTGANTGIGLEISRVLAARGARVLLGCRDKAKAEAAMAKIRSLTPGADLAFLPLDQADLTSIRAAAELAAKEPRIDALINDAGVMNTPLMRTKQGFELQFGVNHLGTFALTALLLPKLSETKGARVVVTSSLAHRNARIDWDDLNADKSYSPFKRYAPSKLANALFFFELNRRLRALGSPVTAVGCPPGMAATDLGRYMGVLQILNPIVSVVLNSAAKRCMARAAGRDRKRHCGRLLRTDRTGRGAGCFGRSLPRAASDRSGACTKAVGCIHRHDRSRSRIAAYELKHVTRISTHKHGEHNEAHTISPLQRLRRNETGELRAAFSGSR